MTAVGDKIGDKVTGGGVEGPQLMATPRTTAFQLADTFAPPKTPRLAQYIQPMPAGAQKLVTEITNRAAAQGPVTRSSSRLAAIATGQASEGKFGWPRESPQGMVLPNAPTQPCASDDEHSNDTSMEEYVYTILSNPLGPVAPSARGRVSGVPAPVRAGPRTRSASLDQRRPVLKIYCRKKVLPWNGTRTHSYKSLVCYTRHAKRSVCVPFLRSANTLFSQL